MPRAIELIQQDKPEELWQMCCGFLSLNMGQFMAIQERLLLEQLELLNRCALGNKIMRGIKPKTVEEFRQKVPLTTYADYCPELIEKREDSLPASPAMWVHTSGRSGEYPCKWVPITPAFSHEMSTIDYGVGILSSCSGWGDVSKMPECPSIVYGVAPRPYVSGAMASMLEQHTPSNFMPHLEEAEKMSFEERVKLGFQMALSQGFDFFFGLSLVLVIVGNKFSEPSEKINILPLLTHPKALFRLTRGLTRSKLAGRRMLPRDLWKLKGIISSGLDSWVYRDKIKELWGRYPLDMYASSEGGVIATQTWDYQNMTFIPSLNFLEFIPEEEHFKWQLDRSYKLKTVLLDEVKAGGIYEIVLTNFHGGAMIRYRIGDMIKINSLRNESLGIDIPQMVFERRADDVLDFVVVRLTEKTIWQAIENAGIPYEDWTAYKEPGEPVLHVFIEPKEGCQVSEAEVAAAVSRHLSNPDDDEYSTSAAHDDLADMINFRVDTRLLPRGAFANYTEQKRAEGADLAHLKPPHLNPPEKVLALLRDKPEKIKAATEARTAVFR